MEKNITGRIGQRFFVQEEIEGARMTLERKAIEKISSASDRHWSLFRVV